MTGMDEKILNLAAAISSAGEAEKELLTLLCQAAEQRLERRLQPGIVPEDCGAAFPCAAALLAAADLYVSRSGGNAVESFTAGMVTIREKSAEKIGAAVQELRQTAVRIMEPYTGDTTFSFLGVRG